MTELYALHRIALPANAGPLFEAVSAALSGLSRRQARETVSAGLVKVDGLTVLEPKHALPDHKVRIEVDLRHGIKAPLRARIHAEVAPSVKPFTILHEDSSVIVLNKASGIVSAPTHKPGSRALGAVERGHVPELLRRAFRKQGRDLKFIGVVHRLDKDTSGCLCFALTREAQRLLSIQFSSHAAARTYRCYTKRSPREDADTIRAALGHGEDGKRAVVDDDEPGKESVTHFKVLRRFAQAGIDRGAELEVDLETGRTHQIRVTLGSIGCPVYGDRVYGERMRTRLDEEAKPPPKAPRLMLHAHRLALDHPLTGERLVVTAPLPPDFVDFAKLLG